MMSIIYFILHASKIMRPDYPSKIFNDKSDNYCCLMEALAADTTCLI
ncbi:MAG TPA: hypothetical protein VIM07_16205 [Chitinophagaceae bacterium]